VFALSLFDASCFLFSKGQIDQNTCCFRSSGEAGGDGQGPPGNLASQGQG